MRAGGGDSQTVRRRRFDNRAAKLDQLVPGLLDRSADARADLHLALVQLRFHVTELRQVGLHDLLDPAHQQAGLGIDDLILLLDPDSERRRIQV